MSIEIFLLDRFELSMVHKPTERESDYATTDLAVSLIRRYRFHTHFFEGPIHVQPQCSSTCPIPTIKPSGEAADTNGDGRISRSVGQGSG